MKLFIPATVLNILLIVGLCISLEENPNYDDMTEQLAGALVLASAFDIPLLLTIPIAATVRNVSVAVCLMIVANIIFELVIADPLNLYSHLELAVMSQVSVGLFVHRAIALWRKRSLVETSVKENFIYRKLAVAPLDWGWRMRMENFINGLTRKIDFVSLPLVLLIIIFSFAVQGFGGFLLASGMYSLTWFLYLSFFILPLMLLEELSRLIFSLSKTTRPKEMSDIALAEISKLRGNLAERDIPGKAKDWIKGGFAVPEEGAKTGRD